MDSSQNVESGNFSLGEVERSRTTPRDVKGGPAGWRSSSTSKSPLVYTSTPLAPHDGNVDHLLGWDASAVMATPSPASSRAREIANSSSLTPKGIHSPSWPRRPNRRLLDSIVSPTTNGRNTPSSGFQSILYSVELKSPRLHPIRKRRAVKSIKRHQEMVKKFTIAESKLKKLRTVNNNKKGILRL